MYGIGDNEILIPVLADKIDYPQRARKSEEE